MLDLNLELRLDLAFQLDSTPRLGYDLACCRPIQAQGSTSDHYLPSGLVADWTWQTSSDMTVRHLFGMAFLLNSLPNLDSLLRLEYTLSTSLSIQALISTSAPRLPLRLNGCLTWQTLQEVTAVVPVLWRGAVVSATFMVLAILLSVADTWPHVVTISVQYLQIKPSCSDLDFAPGKALPPQHLNPMEQDACRCVSNPEVSVGGGVHVLSLRIPQDRDREIDC